MIPELPLTLVQSLERRLITTTAVAAASPFTGSEEVQDWGGEWWDYGIEMARTTGRDGRRLSAFLAALGGPRGRFLFRDPSIRQPGSLLAPFVSGGFQSGQRACHCRMAALLARRRYLRGTSSRSATGTILGSIN